MSNAETAPHSSNLPFVENLYEVYLRHPDSVSDDWREYFKAFANGNGKVAPPVSRPSFRPASLFSPALHVADRENPATINEAQATGLQERVNQLIRNYRVRGHRIARIDPLELPRPAPPELDPANLGFTDADMDRKISSQTFQYNGPLTVRGILERLRNAYCGTIGMQYMHIDDVIIRRWLQKRIEGAENHPQLSRAEQLRIFTRLTDAVTLEDFIQKKFIGAKSFSLEGSESLIPLLDLAVEKAGQQGIQEIVFGMAHRGRLNVLANIIGKSPREIFREFADNDPQSYVGRGDVKYHLGYSGDWKTAAGQKVHLSLCFNPSHLEFVNPIVLGRTRAKQDRSEDSERTRHLALLIHGDAAFAGEGIIQETLNLSRLTGYTVGGTLHVVINNQIGFTTSPEEGRSSTYATDVAKMLQSPIFHVNGEDPEAVAYVVRLAMDFREAFKRDVFIDMYGYRRLGHNESDEPSFTQPLLYRAIEKRKSVREGYLEYLLKLNEITREEADAVTAQRRKNLELELSAAHRPEPPASSARKPGGVWAKYSGGPESGNEEAKTAVRRERLAALLERQTEFPKDFHPHPKIERSIQMRRAMAEGRQPLDWSACEALALATLATDGHRIRLSGQDSARGTFSQRHAVLHDYEDGHTYVPLQHLAGATAPVEIINSPLSEAGVLGFDYGYSLDCPNGLILWEAQYGDFVNAAQVIVDQFIVSAEDKWRRISGLVLLLPHGFEGSGPEHSSARLERFLELAAEDNIQIVQPTTGAQYFHVLRRQVLRSWRKPLVVMTPKSLLRDTRAGSGLDDCASGEFLRIIPNAPAGKQISRVLLCSGKIYYDLDRHRQIQKRNDVAILRMEQLYPLKEELLSAALEEYPDGTPVLWIQEEPENMGAWRYLRTRFGDRVANRFPFRGISRPASASPATGSSASHKQEQQELLAQAFK